MAKLISQLTDYTFLGSLGAIRLSYAGKLEVLDGTTVVFESNYSSVTDVYGLNTVLEHVWKEGLKSFTFRNTSSSDASQVVEKTVTLVWSRREKTLGASCMLTETGRRVVHYVGVGDRSGIFRCICLCGEDSNNELMMTIRLLHDGAKEVTKLYGLKSDWTQFGIDLYWLYTDVVKPKYPNSKIEDIRSVNLKLRDGDDSDEVTYVIDHDPKAGELQKFIFRNEYGVKDYVCVRSEQKSTREYERIVVSVGGETKSVSVRPKLSHVCVTGPMGRVEQRLMRSLFASTEVMLASHPSSMTGTPVVLSDTADQRTNDFTKEVNFQFTWRYVDEQLNYGDD